MSFGGLRFWGNWSPNVERKSFLLLTTARDLRFASAKREVELRICIRRAKAVQV